jgi:hypothetical protein
MTPQLLQPLQPDERYWKCPVRKPDGSICGRIEIISKYAYTHKKHCHECGKVSQRKSNAKYNKAHPSKKRYKKKSQNGIEEVRLFR